MRTIMHQGRRVTKVWYSRFVLNNKHTRGYPREDHRILVNFHMPAIDITGEPAETRLVNLNSIADRLWVQDMTDCYAMPPANELTTFFPNHP